MSSVMEQQRGYSETSAASYEKLSLHIDGEFISGGGRREQAITNPATLQTLGMLPHASTQDLARAVSAAEHAFRSWRRTSPLERSAVLRKVAELTRERAAEIGRNITLDQGKPLNEAIAEAMSSAEHAEWHAEEARRIYGRVVPPRNYNVRQFVIREPVGVCAAFTPWNFPFTQAMRKAAAAIGAGCTLVLKGPEDCPSAVVALARVFHDAGLPKGVLNVVWGHPPDVSRFLIDSPIVRKISFTGSVAVGKQLASAAMANMKRVTMELGGHSPALVLEDADVDAAAEMLARFKVRNAGQICISPSRFYVHEKIYDRFAAKFIAVMEATRIGDGMIPGTQMGPLAHERRLRVMEDFIDDGVTRGGRIALGGSRAAAGQPANAGWFFAPTVLTDLPDTARILQEEPFGPIAPLVRFNDLDDAIERANALPFGLSSFVFTNSIKNATKVSNALECGMVNINHYGSSLAETPFGGVKDSGVGSEGGSETFDGYLVTKFISQV